MVRLPGRVQADRRFELYDSLIDSTLLDQCNSLVVVGQRTGRLQGYRPIVAFDGLDVPVEIQQCIAANAVRVGITRIEGQRSIDARQRILRALESDQRPRAIGKSGKESRLDPKRGVVEF